MSESLRCPLLDLPNELLILIAEMLASSFRPLRNLHSLLLANRRFSLICTPLLIAVAFRDKNLEYQLKGTVLHWAASKGYANLVEKLLAAGIDADIRSRSSSETPLERAATYGYTRIMQLLISRGASVRQKYANHVTPLERAAVNGHVSAIDVLVENGAYLNSREDDKDWKEGGAWGEWREGNRALHAAARNGHLDAVKKLLDYGASVNAMDYEGVTVLLKAAQHRSYGVVCYLASTGISISDTDDNGDTALHLSIRDHQTTELLCRSSILNVRNKFGCIALHYACGLMIPHSTKILLSSGADIEATTIKGRTPLIYALAVPAVPAAPRTRDDPDLLRVIEILLEYGANVNAATPSGLTALHLAASRGHVTIVQKLISSGASVRASKRGYYPEILDAAKHGYGAIIDILIANGAFFNSRKGDEDHKEGDAWGEWQEGNKVLHEAVCYGRIDIVKKLLGCGASANAKDDYGRTVLIKAAKRREYGIVRLLASTGSCISDTDTNGDTALHLSIRDHQTTELLCQPSILDVRNIHGCTALHYACEFRLPHSVRALISSGANVDSTNNEGWSPLMLTLSTKFEIRDEPNLVQVIEILLEYGANANAISPDGLTALQYATSKGCATIMQKLISSGASVRASKHSASPLIWDAARNGDGAAIDILAANGAYFHAREEDKFWTQTYAWGEWRDGNKALHLAARGDHIDAVRKLIGHGASTSAKDREGRVVLSVAAQYAAYRVISFLLSIGVNISEVDHDGNTALHLAILDDHGDSGTDLCHASIINARNDDDLTALHLACRQGEIHCIKALLECGADIEAKNDMGRTPLIFTFADAYDLGGDDGSHNAPDTLPQVLTTLLASGANIDAVDKDGWSALDHAVWFDNDDKVGLSRTLLEHGADPDGGDGGTTPLHTAQRLGHQDVVEYLLEKGANRDLLDSEGRTYLDI